MYLEIKGQGVSGIKIVGNLDDEGGVHSNVSIAVEGHKANFYCWMMYDDFKSFHQNIKDVINGESNKITFSTIEDQVSFTGVVTSDGMIGWNGYTDYPLPDGNRLEFSFDSFLDTLEKTEEELSVLIK
jgi:hypothetical protein